MMVCGHDVRRNDLRLYRIWKNIKTRCNNPNFYLYNRYGGRGIRVCNEWENSFENFYEWAMNNGYTDELTIDRINNDKGYAPGNCRWATRNEQSRNNSRVVMVSHNGKTQCIKDWSKELGIPAETLRRRLLNGLTIEIAFSKTDRRIDNGKNFKKLF